MSRELIQVIVKLTLGRHCCFMGRISQPLTDSSRDRRGDEMLNSGRLVSRLDAYAGDNASSIKRRNRALLLELIFRQGPISRATLSDQTRLSRAAVTLLTAELLENGIITEIAQVPPEGRRSVGRSPVGLVIREDFGKVVAVDVSRQRVSAALVNLRAAIDGESSREIVDARDPLHVAGLVGQCIAELRQHARMQGSRLLGIGISLPGIIERTTGVLEYSSTLGWEKVNLIDLFGVHGNLPVDLPVVVDRNVRGMVLAEHLFGVGQGFANLALVYVGIGIGCGIMINGATYAGSLNRAGEIGHTLVSERWSRSCYCGNRGCLETVASGRAIAEIAVEAIQSGTASQIEEIVKGDLTQVTAEVVSQAATEEDELAARVLEDAGRYLGIAIANLLNSIDPQLIILAGGVMNAGDLLLEPVRRIIRERGLVGDAQPEVRLSRFGEKVGVIGAGALALREFVYSEKDVSMSGTPGNIGSSLAPRGKSH